MAEIPPNQIESRKKDHVELVVSKAAQYAKTSGLEKVEFIHNALPEISIDSIDLSTEFLGKKINYPILITGMTGGYSDAEQINKKESEQWIVAVGQRAQEKSISLTTIFIKFT